MTLFLLGSSCQAPLLDASISNKKEQAFANHTRDIFLEQQTSSPLQSRLAIFSFLRSPAIISVNLSQCVVCRLGFAALIVLEAIKGSSLLG